MPWLLLVDQLVFLMPNLLLGMARDRAARVLGRMGHAVIAATLLSTLAFVLLPWVAPMASPLLLTVLSVSKPPCSTQSFLDRSSPTSQAHLPQPNR